MLKAHDSRRFDAVHWLRESFAGTRQHDDATGRAMRAAFVDFVGRLDPRDLATRFERSARRKTMGNWELYGEFYRSLCEMQPGALPHIFVETFAQNYDQAARDGDDGRRAPATPPDSRIPAPPLRRLAKNLQLRRNCPCAIRLGDENRHVAGDSKDRAHETVSAQRVLSRRRHPAAARRLAANHA